MVEEAEDALAIFGTLTSPTDGGITEADLTELIAEVKKMVSSCRKRSLVHTAKQLGDLQQQLFGAKLVLSKGTPSAARAVAFCTDRPRFCLPRWTRVLTVGSFTVGTVAPRSEEIGGLP